MLPSTVHFPVPLLHLLFPILLPNVRIPPLIQAQLLEADIGISPLDECTLLQSILGAVGGLASLEFWNLHHMCAYPGETDGGVESQCSNTVVHGCLAARDVGGSFYRGPARASVDLEWCCCDERHAEGEEGDQGGHGEGLHVGLRDLVCFSGALGLDERAIVAKGELPVKREEGAGAGAERQRDGD